AQRGIEVSALLQVHTAADARGIDKRPHTASNLNLLVNRIARRASEVVHHDTLFTGSLIEQARLTHVRAAKQRYAARSTEYGLRNRRLVRHHVEHCIEQISGTTAVERR